MADVARLRRLLAGSTLVEGPPLSDDQVAAQAAQRAWLAQWYRARPLVPPLDRLSAAALAELRAGR